MTADELAQAAAAQQAAALSIAKENEDRAAAELAEFDPYFPVVQGRLFRLVRYDDPSGVSGCGVVGQGFQAPDGAVALRWCVPSLPATWNLFDSIEDLQLLNGHQGRTVVKWVDGRD